jgi:hypothetical protein
MSLLESLKSLALIYKLSIKVFIMFEQSFLFIKSMPED